MREDRPGARVTKRISVPAEAVRTPEAILAGLYVAGGYVWTTCHNCGGSGNYPSSMSPPGKCRFLCWADRSQDTLSALMGNYRSKPSSDPTFGKLPYPVAVYVKKAQASDRREFRAAAKWKLERPAREAAEAAARLQAEIDAYAEDITRSEEAAYLFDRTRTSQHVGTVGARVELTLRVVDRRRFPASNYGWTDRYLFRMRDESGNVFIWWTTSGSLGLGETVPVKATIKAHSEYNGEKQTEVQRVKVVGAVKAELVGSVAE
jgi:hypothetical protein